MDIVFSVFGTYGDLIPSIAVAKQLQNSGKKVLFLSNSYYSDLVKSEGIEFESVGTVEEYQQGMHASGFGQTEKGNKILLKKTVVPSIKRQFEIVKSLSKKSSNLKVVTPGATNGAFMAAENLGLDIVKILFSPLYTSQYLAKPKLFSLNSRYGFEMRTLNNARNDVGLKKLTCFTQTLEVERCAIGLYPDWFVGSSGLLHPAVQPTSFTLFQPKAITEQEKFDAFVQAFGPPIIFTAGTVVEPPKDFFNESQLICEKLGRPGVFIGVNTNSHTLPEYICSVNKLDMHKALPQSRLIVHHGGIGTMTQAMKAGIPQIIVPRVNDQFYNASRATAFGSAGIIVHKYYKADHVINVIRNLLYTEKLQSMRKELAAEMQTQQGCTQAANIIASLH
jgi:rhamnosyltransferase subunit B